MTLLPDALAAHLGERIAAARVPTSALLAEALAGAPGLDQLLQHARFDDATYVRVPLGGGPGWEARLLCWQPGQSSALHGHGPSACAFQVLAGQATELLLDGTLRQLGPGERSLAEEGVVHQVGNQGQQALVGLHLYAPALPIEQPSLAEGRQVVILGGGWSGVALAVHLLRSKDPSLRITLVESHPVVGRGVAYGTDREEHLLNVPAGGMSLDPLDPGDFEAFAWGRVPDVHPNALLPRRLVALYLRDRLVSAIARSPARLRIARSCAQGIAREGQRWRVTLDDGRALAADAVVLATGHGPTVVPPSLQDLVEHPAVIADPWAPGALTGVRVDARVLVVGTGLTAVDALTTLHRLGLRGPVHAVSRNGRWPLPHLPGVRWDGGPVPLSAEPPASVDGLAEWLQAEVDGAAERGVPWQAVIDAVRPRIAGLWAGLDADQRARFLSTYRGQWEVIRHRVPRPTWETLRRWRAEGWLINHAGLGAVEPVGDGLRVQVGATAVEVDRVVLCCGNLSDPRRFTAPLWRGLLGDGLAVADPHGLGLLTDGRGAVLGADGSPTPGMWALGGLRRPFAFESTAVPELARQAAALAAELVPPRDEPLPRALSHGAGLG